MGWFFVLFNFSIVIVWIMIMAETVARRNNNPWMGLPYALLAAILVFVAIWIIYNNGVVK